MRRTLIALACTFLVFTVVAAPAIAQDAQEPQAPTTRTMRPVITGRLYAASSMKPQATGAAVRILEAGGNAFDAAVAGQAVLALVDPSLNGFGSDSATLVYDAVTRQVVSINGAARRRRRSSPPSSGTRSTTAASCR